MGQTSGFCLTVTALGTGAALIDHVVQGAVPIEGHAHQTTRFPVEVLDTAFLFEELRMVTAFAVRCGKEQRATKALGAIAVGMHEERGGMHAQTFATARHAVGVTTTIRMAVLIERDGSDAVPMHYRLVDVPGIIGRISGDVGREAV